MFDDELNKLHSIGPAVIDEGFGMDDAIFHDGGLGGVGQQLMPCNVFFWQADCASSPEFHLGFEFSPDTDLVAFGVHGCLVEKGAESSVLVF